MPTMSAFTHTSWAKAQRNSCFEQVSLSYIHFESAAVTLAAETTVTLAAETTVAFSVHSGGLEAAAQAPQHRHAVVKVAFHTQLLLLPIPPTPPHSSSSSSFSKSASSH